MYEVLVEILRKYNQHVTTLFLAFCIFNEVKSFTIPYVEDTSTLFTVLQLNDDISIKYNDARLLLWNTIYLNSVLYF